MKQKKPNYKKIYTDILEYSNPDKKKICAVILNKKDLSNLDVLLLNKLIFGDKNNVNQKFKSYNKETIFEILDFQKMHNLSNVKTAKHFKLSRNTIGKWKKKYFVKKD